MRRILYFSAIFFLLFFLSGKPVVFGDAPRYADCDLCGYCPPNSPPQNWSDCQKCIYPNINPDPGAKESLLIDPNTNLPPTPAPGHQYTFLGCLGGSSSFTSSGSAGGVVQSILNIVFSIAGGIAFLYLIYGSFIIATSQAAPERLNYGKRLVSGAIIGLIFTLGSVLVVNFIASGILKVPGFGQ
ncbi:pilin [Patescibacteria group bacterium]|nr:pilin [Patescibacteria group bacterium]